MTWTNPLTEDIIDNLPGTLNSCQDEIQDMFNHSCKSGE